MTPGLRTSEFKVAVLTVGVAVVSALADWVSNRYAFAGGVLGAVGYVVSRGLAKTEPREPVTTPGTTPGAAK
jgi:hypothetical protein